MLGLFLHYEAILYLKKSKAEFVNIVREGRDEIEILPHLTIE